MAKITRVILVGHCGADSGMLHRVVGDALKNVPVAVCNDERSLESQARPDSLLLVNRVLDGAFSAGGGIDLIRAIAKRKEKPAMMLVSNYAEAQAEAVAAGALPGFGKSQAYDAATAKLLQGAAGESA